MFETILSSLSATDFWIAIVGQITTDASAKVAYMGVKLASVAAFGSLTGRILPVTRSVPSKRIRRGKKKSRVSKTSTSVRSRARRRRT
jgi:hypothetical protein